MSTEILEIQPRELKFVYELKKQSTCSVRLLNTTSNYVAFKVKTTSPKKYCVRPNVGIVKPKSTAEFVVTMQAPRTATPDLTCKDKFLVQSSVVPLGTTDEDITPRMFLKDDGKYVEEKKLKVILVSPLNSPVLSPINGTMNSAPDYEPLKPKDQFLGGEENISPSDGLSKDVELKRKPGGETEPAKDAAIKVSNSAEEAKVKDMGEMKFKINLLESKLSEAEVTISKLTEERRLTTQESENLKRELALLRNKKGVKRIQVGFPLLFVCMVALISMVLGYRMHC